MIKPKADGPMMMGIRAARFVTCDDLKIDCHEIGVY
eukprot:COSAG01_NODE_55976_length_321_cov_1.198198_1_plen_35_part_10